MNKKALFKKAQREVEKMIVQRELIIPENTVKEFVYYHEAIVSIVEPEVIRRSDDRKSYVKIPESFIYNKEVHFIEDKKIDLSKTKKEKLEKILLSLQHKLKINDRYKLKFKEITKWKKL